MMRAILTLLVAAGGQIAFAGEANSLAAQDVPLFASHDMVEILLAHASVPIGC